MCECPLTNAYHMNGNTAGSRYGKNFLDVNEKFFRRRISMYTRKIIAAKMKILIGP